MKETVNVNIASHSFTLDSDAYETLRNYLDEIRSRLPEEDHETLEDVEARIAEIFREEHSSSIMVVSLASVQHAITQLGQPEDFGDSPRDDGRSSASETSRTPPRRLYRPLKDRSIAGVCAGIAQYLHVDTTVVRLITLALILFGGLSIWVYVILWLVIPEEPQNFRFHQRSQSRR